MAPWLQIRYTCLLEYLVDHRYFSITEEEIQDRSHADALSKAIAIVQTTWFILQCLGRGLQGLAITELEIITLAFAFLNIIVYFLWWNKPLRVRYPVRVTWRPRNEDLPPRTMTDRVKAPSRSFMSSVRAGFVRIQKYIVTDYHDTNKRWEDLKLFHISSVLFIPLYPILSLLFVLGALAFDDDATFPNSFFSARLEKDPIKLYPSAYVAAISFGAIHCIAWAFEFPTETERMEWRIMSLLVTILPLAIGILHATVQDRQAIDFRERIRGSGIVACAAKILLPIVYAVARVWLIVLALVTLRKLPASAYQASQWTSFIPHIC
ncbi:hypothetical protein Moror_3457 [Moniliophthora roreri MCA 2997]|nr:hypothetical protein Moror_3457 [Moniliophthora roreri MCA 2997]